MRTGNGRTSFKPGRRQETKSVGYAVRSRRLPPTPTAPRSPVALPVRNELSDLVARPVLPPPRATRARRGRGPSGVEQPRSCRRVRTSPRPAFVVGRASRPRRHASCSARLARKRASCQAHRRHRAGRWTRSWRGAPQRPTGRLVLLRRSSRISRPASRPGVDCAALPGCGSGSTTVPCLCVSSNSSERGSARIAPACHRSVILQA